MMVWWAVGMECGGLVTLGSEACQCQTFGFLVSRHHKGFTSSRKERRRLQPATILGCGHGWGRWTAVA